jgi:hypothetical protein
VSGDSPDLGQRMVTLSRRSDHALEVNGATMERGYFEENLREAEACSWASAVVIDDHHHCIVCTVSVGRGESAFNDGHRWLCGYRHEHYLVSGEKP